MLLVKVYLKQTNRGFGIFAAERIKKNQTVWAPDNLRIITSEEFKRMSKTEKEFVSKYACSLPDGRKYVDRDLALFWNHSCEPNTKKSSRHSDMQVASMDIKKDEELTCDYTDDPSYLEKGFRCTCGSKKCKGIINKNKPHWPMD